MMTDEDPREDMARRVWTLLVISHSDSQYGRKTYQAGPRGRTYDECWDHAGLIIADKNAGRLPEVGMVTIVRGGNAERFPGLLPGEEFLTDITLVETVAKHFGFVVPEELSIPAYEGWVRVVVAFLEQRKRVERLPDWRGFRLVSLPDKHDFPTASL